MYPQFHLSIGVKSIQASTDFFVNFLNAKILHQDPSGYVNIDFYGTQITLKENPSVDPKIPNFHFGVNLTLSDFETVSKKLLHDAKKYVVVAPEVWDAGTPIERKKMYVKCPTGYTIELKGYRS